MGTCAMVWIGQYRGMRAVWQWLCKGRLSLWKLNSCNQSGCRFASGTKRCSSLASTSGQHYPWQEKQAHSRGTDSLWVLWTEVKGDIFGILEPLHYSSAPNEILDKERKERKKHLVLKSCFSTRIASLLKSLAFCSFCHISLLKEMLDSFPSPCMVMTISVRCLVAEVEIKLLSSYQVYLVV